MTIKLNDGTEFEIYDFNQTYFIVNDTLLNICNNIYSHITDSNLSSFIVSDAVDVSYEYFRSDNIMEITPAEDGKVYAKFYISQLSETEIEIDKLYKAIASNGTLTIIFANISSLPSTIYNDAITSDMVVTGKEFSNSEAVIENMKVTIADGSVTISGVITGTTDITLYLTKSN